MGILMNEDRAAAHYGMEGALAQRINDLTRERDALKAELAVYQGKGLTASGSCFHVTSYIDDAEVLVEIDYEGESGDGWNEPRYEESCAPINVLINGVWVCASHFSEELLERWTEAAWEHLKDEREYAEECRAEAIAESRRLRMGDEL